MFHNIASRLRGTIPSRQQLAENRWLRWLGPWLKRPEYWRWSRRSVALGVGIGVFCGLLFPVAQFPLAAVTSIVLRANLPAAAASTLITNPVTAGPIYYAAYQTGSKITNTETLTKTDFRDDGTGALTDKLLSIGKPLLIGLAVFATVSGVVIYFLISLAWRWRTLYLRRKSRRSRIAQST